MRTIKAASLVTILVLTAAIGCWRMSGGTVAHAQARADAPRPATAYVGSVKSNVYHLPTCRSAKRISPANLITFASRQEAEKAGYRPCLVCKP